MNMQLYVIICYVKNNKLSKKVNRHIDKLLNAYLQRKEIRKTAFFAYIFFFC